MDGAHCRRRMGRTAAGAGRKGSMGVGPTTSHLRTQCRAGKRFWSRAERQAFRVRASELGADSKLIYCEATREELKRRLLARNADLPPDTFAVTPDQLDEMWPHLEPPGEDELK